MRGPQQLTQGAGMRWARLAAPAAVMVAAGAGCAAVWWGDPTAPGGPFPLCPTKALLGSDCPGCGGLRMVYSLLHGDLAAAAHYNAVALVALPLLFWVWGAWVLARWRGSQVSIVTYRRWAPAVTIAVMLVWLVVRNIPVAPFTALYV